MMKLSKVQIQEIDQRLKKGGIKYWDVRIEMVDHLVTDIEHYATSNDFDTELIAALKRVGWYNSLDDVNTQSWKNTNKLYRRKFFKEIWKFISSIRGLTLLLLFVTGHYYISTVLSHDIFIKVNYILFVLPIFFFLCLGIYIGIKKYGRSVHIDYGLNYMMFSFIILQIFPQSIIKNAAEDSQIIMWLILLPLYLIMFYAGYKGFQSAFKKVKQMKQILND